jgi:hypothetical protein
MRSLSMLLLVALTSIAGCASYIPPGPKADFNAVAPQSVRAGFEAKPAATFPVGIAAVRIQAPAYTNYYIQHNGGIYGGGGYTVITAHEAGEPEQLDRVTALPRISGLISINRMLLPQTLRTDLELREAAARLQADLLLLYTFDTSFYDTDVSKPITLLTLGLSPTRKIHVTTTASALLLDTRSGYVYSAYEATQSSDSVASSWGSADAADAGRRQNEKAAFSKMVDEFVSSWPKFLDRYAKQG